MIEKYFTTKEAADRLGYSVDNIYRITFAGKLIPTKVYGRNLYAEEELTRFEEIRKAKADKHKSSTHE